MYDLARFSLRAPRTMLLLLALATLALGAGLPRVHPGYGVAPLLGHDHPALLAQDRLVEAYGGGHPLLIAWECGEGWPCASPFDTASLSMAYELETQLAEIPGVRMLRGLATAPLLVPDPSGFAVRRLVDEQGQVAPDAALLGQRALDDPFWRGTLVSPDGLVGAVVLVPADALTATLERVIDRVLEVLPPLEARGFAFHLAGHPAESVLTGRDLEESTARITPLCVAIIGLVVFALLRCWRSVLASLLTVGVAVLWTFGLLGWLGWEQDSLLQVLAPLLLVMGVCDAVHLLSNAAREQSVLRAARSVGPACVITTLTTAAAFLSFALSPLLGFVHFGVIAAFGVLACLLLSFTLLPLLTLWLPPSAAAAAPAVAVSSALIRRVVRVSQRFGPVFLGVAAVLLAAGSYGWAAYLRVDTDAEKMWGEQNRVVQWMRFVDSRLRGIDSLEIDVTPPAGQDFASASTQQGLARLESFLEAQPGFESVTGTRDLVARVNRLLHDDDPAWERAGESEAADAQLLELVAMGEPELLRGWLSLDRTRTRLSVAAGGGSSGSRGEPLQRVRDFFAQQLPGWGYALTGPFAMEHAWAAELQRSQLRSFGGAFVLVFALVAWFLRSLRLGFAALVPAVLPVVATLGFMGFAGQLLDVGRTMVAAIVIGVAVDDAIHVLTHYREQRARGIAPAAAIEEAAAHTGPAVVVTSLALALGFLALAGSAWASIASFGVLVCAAILGALAATLLVLPPVVLALEGELHSSTEMRSKCARSSSSVA